jgi:hypothetical protein
MVSTLVSAPGERPIRVIHPEGTTPPAIPPCPEDCPTCGARP